MHKHDGLATSELIELGYPSQPDGRLRKGNSWKAHCSECQRWFHRLKGNYCRGCFDKRAIAYVRKIVDAEKKRSKHVRRSRLRFAARLANRRGVVGR